ncbi:MAG: ATP-binding protein [Pseudomonadota bacterium]
MKRVLMYGAYGVLYVAMPLIVLAILYVVDQPYNVPSAYRVLPTEWVRSFSETPPTNGWSDDTSRWPPGRQDGEPFTSVWYRYTVPERLDTPTLYIPYGFGNFEVWQGGTRLYQLATPKPPLAYSRTSIAVPLRDGDVGSRIEVRLTRQASYSGIRYVFVAPSDLAARDASDQALFETQLPIAVLVLMLGFAAAVGAMFALRPKERHYGWYALTIGLWAAHSIHGLIEAIPFAHFVWFALRYVLLNWLLAELFFVNRYFGIRAPRLEGFCAAVSVLVSLGLIAVASVAASSLENEARFFASFTVVNLWFLLLAFIVTSRYFVAVRKHWDFDSVSLWLASAVVIGIGIRDLVYEAMPPGTVPGSVFYLQYAAVVPLILFGIQLIRRFARDARTAELRNEALNQIVEERTTALEKTYQQLSEEAQKRALAEERSRLMRDMHDGLGGQLVHALALSEQVDDADLKRALRLALDDLRLIVDSLSPTANSLQDLMASYRHRVSRLLQRTGFNVSWDIADETDSVTLKPNEALSVLRIVQEAVTNAVRHSGGDTLQIAVARVADGLQLTIRDNGAGMPESVVERGLRNMRVRAAELGAGLNISSTSGDTAVTMHLPLAGGAPAT